MSVNQSAEHKAMFHNILVTGGAGFIGSNLTLSLAQEFPEAKITVIDDFRSGHFQNLEGFRGDFIAADLSTLDPGHYFPKGSLDAVFHLASITDTTDHDQKRQVHDNVESWRNLLGHAAGSSTRLVYASSAATYGVAGGINRIDQALKPANVYAFSKVHLENLAQQFVRENPQQWIVGLRYFNVYGPREGHKGAAASMIYQLAQQMQQGQRPRIFTAGEQKRDFVYVKDIVRYTIAAARSEQAKTSGKDGLCNARIYNAGSGIARSFNEIVANLNRVLGTDLAAHYIDNPYSFYQPHTEADLSHSIPTLGAQEPTSLETGIEDYYASGWLTGHLAEDRKKAQ